ncbi:hypothetical protein [Nocardia gipuzkoensis]|uniref:hypothetical protein n=1 Tax=Nocardia gipuzkoensis TaxID=2749991 RepID=UPI00237E8A32|nr:hypothetical protein [Nocardia gipuzkoensis]MDE1673188.1 hypothetical protein [Nocardia gipuzkoensis]
MIMPEYIGPSGAYLVNMNMPGYVTHLRPGRPRRQTDQGAPMCADHAPIPFNARQRRTHRPEPHQPTGSTPGGGKGRMWVGPTSEQTRRLVAESRIRQGLPPQIDDPAVIESLALFLRNALNTVPRDRDEDRDDHRRAA